MMQYINKELNQQKERKEEGSRGKEGRGRGDGRKNGMYYSEHVEIMGEDEGEGNGRNRETIDDVENYMKI